MQQIPKSATRRTARVSATERFHATAGRSTSVKALVGAIAVVFLVVVGFIFLSPRSDPEIERYHVEKKLEEARRLEDQGKLDLAQTSYEEAIRLMVGEMWRTQIIETRGRIKDLKQRGVDLANAEAEWKALRSEAEACPPERLRPVAERARVMMGRHRGVPWAAELAALVQKLEKKLDELRVPDPQTRRAEIAKERKLDGPKGSADWSGAIRDWRSYLALQLTEEWRRTVPSELTTLQRLAREDLDPVGRRAGRMAEEGNRREAVALLKSQRGRFELTDSAPALEKLIAQYDR